MIPGESLMRITCMPLTLVGGNITLQMSPGTLMESAGAVILTAAQTGNSTIRFRILHPGE